MAAGGAGCLWRERGKPRARRRHNNRGDGAHLNKEMKHDAHDAFSVVPAKAGTHNTRFSGDKGNRWSALARTTMVQEVWVPAFAGTTGERERERDRSPLTRE
nr:hypothetical protein DBT46_10490 [Aerococcus mictus]